MTVVPICLFFAMLGWSIWSELIVPRELRLTLFAKHPWLWKCWKVNLIIVLVATLALYPKNFEMSDINFYRYLWIMIAIGIPLMIMHTILYFRMMRDVKHSTQTGAWCTANLSMKALFGGLSTFMGLSTFVTKSTKSFERVKNSWGIACAQQFAVFVPPKQFHPLKPSHLLSTISRFLSVGGMGFRDFTGFLEIHQSPHILLKMLNF